MPRPRDLAALGGHGDLEAVGNTKGRIPGAAPSMNPRSVRCTIVPVLSSVTATELLPDDAPRQIMPTRSVLSESGLLTVYRCVEPLAGTVPEPVSRSL
jgi:hypothetical protein